MQSEVRRNQVYGVRRPVVHVHGDLVQFAIVFQPQSDGDAAKVDLLYGFAAVVIHVERILGRSQPRQQKEKADKSSTHAEIPERIRAGGRCSLCHCERKLQWRRCGEAYFRLIAGQRHPGCHLPSVGETNVIEEARRAMGGNFAQSTSSS